MESSVNIALRFLGIFLSAAIGPAWVGWKLREIIKGAREPLVVIEILGGLMLTVAVFCWAWNVDQHHLWPLWAEKVKWVPWFRSPLMLWGVHSGLAFLLELAGIKVLRRFR